MEEMANVAHRPAMKRRRRILATLGLPVRIACVGGAACLSACETPLVGPAAVITYHQVGACNLAGTASAGPDNAFAVFAIDRIDNTASGITFNFDPLKLYFDATNQFYSLKPPQQQTQLADAQNVLGSQQIAMTTINAGATHMFGNSPFGMIQVATTAADGASEANRSSYFLSYATGTGDPPIVFKKLNLGRGLWPDTSNCDAINLGTGNFLYALASTVNSTIVPASIDSVTGTLTVGTSVATGSTSTIAIEPSSRFLYAVNSGSISTFAINQTNGGLTKIGGDVAAAFDSHGAAVDPSGSYLYVVSTNENTIRTYKIAQPTGGGLTLFATTPMPPGTSPFAVIVEPSGRFVYTLNSTSPPGETISGFAIGQMGSPSPGVLTAIGTTTLPSSFLFAATMTASQGGGFLYVASTAGPVAGFSIDPQTGALTSLAAVGSPWGGGPSPVALETDPYGASLYVANGPGGGSSNSTISVLAITATKGSLSQVQAFPLQQFGENIFDGFAIDRTGNFLYELSSFNASQGAIYGYGIGGANGTLTNLGQAAVNGGFFAGGSSNQTVLAAAGTIE